MDTLHTEAAEFTEAQDVMDAGGNNFILIYMVIHVKKKCRIHLIETVTS